MKNFLTSIFMLLLIAGLSTAQTGKESIFGDVEKLITEAREKQADLLSPEYFTKAMDSFNKANEYYINNESTRDVREKLTEAQRYCQRALEVVKLGAITLKEPFLAREDALTVEANVYSPELFNEAEEKFFDAARQIEDDDLDDARDYGAQAEKLYRQAELKSIKGKLLSDGRKLVQEAEDTDVEEYAPQTFNKSKKLLSEVENILTYNRYSGSEAASKAIETVYEANHAIFLASQIKTLSNNDKNWEKLILEYEQVLAGFASHFNETPMFDNGMKSAIDLINSRIEKLDKDYAQLLVENSKLQEKYDVLSEEASTSSAELAMKKEREAKFSKIKSIFTANEATVITEGNNLVIRLHGLNFPSGKATLQPEYFSLLTKVQEALRVFPEKHILLEGHTDSRGNATKNKQLSEERAIAVREYIIANMGKSREQITSIGYGSAKPVATNQTAQGRELNRRIDVVISLND
jgi:outer membrane protein OmpA-like peptidoglycan-associated protein